MTPHAATRPPALTPARHARGTALADRNDAHNKVSGIHENAVLARILLISATSMIGVGMIHDVTDAYNEDRVRVRFTYMPAKMIDYQHAWPKFAHSGDNNIGGLPGRRGSVRLPVLAFLVAVGVSALGFPLAPVAGPVAVLLAAAAGLALLVGADALFRRLFGWSLATMAAGVGIDLAGNLARQALADPHVRLGLGVVLALAALVGALVLLSRILVARPALAPARPALRVRAAVIEPRVLPSPRVAVAPRARTRTRAEDQEALASDGGGDDLDLFGKDAS